MEPSARDDDGRGTHVAFCLVDNQVRDASYYGLAHEIAKGGVLSLEAVKASRAQGCIYSVSLVVVTIYLMSQREKSMLSLTKRPDLHESRHIDLPKATNTCLVYGTSIEEYLRIWGNISRTLGSAILTNASSRMKLTNHKEINYPS
ncbi:hypothetical protein R6Q59_002853 [Mikania micrantha]